MLMSVGTRKMGKRIRKVKRKKTLFEYWYLDSGCSNHMTSHKEWLINFDSSKDCR